MKSASKFAKGSGAYKCECCGRLTRSTGRGDNENVGNCAECYDLAGEQNSLSDSGSFYESPARILEMIGIIVSKGGDASNWDDIKKIALQKCGIYAHTPGPWSQGKTLRTSQTQQWTPEQWSRNQAIEHRMVFARFTSADEGRSRILVAQCDREDDARLIAAAPELLAALQLAVESLHKAFDYVPAGNENAACRGNLVPTLQNARAAIAKATS